MSHRRPIVSMLRRLVGNVVMGLFIAYALPWMLRQPPGRGWFMSLGAGWIGGMVTTELLFLIHYVRMRRFYRAQGYYPKDGLRFGR